MIGQDRGAARREIFRPDLLGKILILLMGADVPIPRGVAYQHKPVLYSAGVRIHAVIKKCKVDLAVLNQINRHAVGGFFLKCGDPDAVPVAVETQIVLPHRADAAEHLPARAG